MSNFSTKADPSGVEDDLVPGGQLLDMTAHVRDARGFLYRPSARIVRYQ
jgi:hypothetical protein